jgi:formylmethanofuran dehydrogenase subunit D
MDAEVSIITFNDIFQYEARMKGLNAEEHQKRSAQIFLDKSDLDQIGLKDGQEVRAENESGKIVITARLSDDDPHPGLAFMVASPWSNQLMRDDVCAAGAPGEAKARISPSEDQVTEISEIFDRIVS